MLTVRSAGLSDIGRLRAGNEDRWACFPELGLYIVADGLGGCPSGDVASAVVVEALPALVTARFREVVNLAETPDAVDRMRFVLCETSNALRREADDAGVSGLGSTVVTILVRGEHALIAHMGDSRAYLLRGSQLSPLTRDHTLRQLLTESGDTAPASSESDPAKGCLTRYIGMKGEPLPECRLLSILPGDTLLLCSDGLTGMLDETAIQHIIMSQESPVDICAQLVSAANDAGGRDNICVIVLKVVNAAVEQPKESGLTAIENSVLV